MAAIALIEETGTNGVIVRIMGFVCQGQNLEDKKTEYQDNTDRM